MKKRKRQSIDGKKYYIEYLGSYAEAYKVSNNPVIYTTRLGHIKPIHSYLKTFPTKTAWIQHYKNQVFTSLQSARRPYFICRRSPIPPVTVLKEITLSHPELLI